ncbi:hypothetical protein ACFFX0_12460 [Citricoccus parietis]|uniref:Uncharacterized protein n=1 Tax=Citricoccus parietis TaxID=592307 RepID=A0ABV5FZ53_9MICC
MDQLCGILLGEDAGRGAGRTGHGGHAVREGHALIVFDENEPQMRNA